MKDLLIKIKNFSIITIIASFVIGLVLLIWPNESITAVSILTGVTTILLGVTAWISYFAKEKSIILATAGTVCIIIGIIICVKYQSIIAILLFLFGIFITISGAVDLITSFYSRAGGLGTWGVSTVLSAAVLILGVVIMVNPLHTSQALAARLYPPGLPCAGLLPLPHTWQRWGFAARQGGGCSPSVQLPVQTWTPKFRFAAGRN